jgi:hypothetical protein
MRAAVFVRRSGADGVGHVGWAFEGADGTFCTGSIENPGHTLISSPRDMGFWALRTLDPIAPMRGRRYTDFKLITLDDPQPLVAWRVVAWVSRHSYDVFGHNCMNATYDVLRSYGVPRLPAPAHHWEPNHWFNHVDGRVYRIDDDAVQLATSGARNTPVGPELPDLNVLLAELPAVLPAVVPAWRIADTPDWHALQAELAAMPPPPVSPGRHERPRLAALFGKLLHPFRAHH